MTRPEAVDDGPEPDIDDEAARVAREVFGWQHFRAGLGDAIRTVIAGTDLLAIMPTGYGKSSICEVAGTVLGGVTIVVSPLIALQEDQVRTLSEVSSAPAAVAINSSQGAAAERAGWNRLETQRAGFVFLAPEQLASDALRARLAGLPLSLFVVDEAHCVSAWGHDFRPDYLVLGDAIEALGHPPVLAMTATGSTPVRREIVEKLGMTDHRLIARGFDRPNLHLSVVRHETDDEKRRAVTAQAEQLVAAEAKSDAARSSGLIYVATRRDSERYAAELAEAGIRTAAYNGGMAAHERERVYREFIGDAVEVVAATSAFGMGIDKPTVRFVVHAAVTDSLDSYYQEVGRAGRDGLPARAILHYRPEDFALTSFFEGGSPDTDELESVFSAVAAAPERTRAELAGLLARDQRSLSRLLGLLEDAGVVSSHDERLTARPGSAQDAAARVLEHVETRRRVEHSRTQMMQEFAETRSCRRQFLLGYFGEDLPDPCGNCDTCDSGSAYEAARDGRRNSSGYAIDTRVHHRTWGDGVVMRVEDDRVTVFFDQQGYRVLSLDDIAKYRLLEPVE